MKALNEWVRGATRPRRWQEFVGPTLFCLGWSVVLVLVGANRAGALTFAYFALALAFFCGFHAARVIHQQAVSEEGVSPRALNEPPRFRLRSLGAGLLAAALVVLATSVFIVETTEPLRIVLVVGASGTWFVFGATMGRRTQSRI